MSAEAMGASLLILGVFLLLGMWIRIVTPLFQRLFLPTSIITGLLLLLLGPEVFGRIIQAMGGEGSRLAEGLFPEFMLDTWELLPELLISVIFTCLFLGKKIPSPKKMWSIAGPQITFGQMMAWGQYTLGILLALLVLGPFFGLPPVAGALIEISFEGGHGTAAGLANTFEQVDFAEGADMALGLATVSMISGVIICIAIINWGVRKNKAEHLRSPSELTKTELRGIIPEDERESAGKIVTRGEAIETLTIHFGAIGVSILGGFLLLEGLVLLENWLFGSDFMTYVPLFTFAMLASVALQVLLNKFDKNHFIDRNLILRVQGFSLDILIVSAMATLSLSVIGDNIIPFILLAVVGIVWNVLVFFLLAPRMIPSYWFEKGMGDLGQSLGMTATGLLLLKVTDPKEKTPATEGFGYKQLMFEPILGGGLFTAFSLPLIFQFGPIPILILTTMLLFGWLLLGLLYFGKKKE
ncbi:sodium/glutamate symporter [Bacillus horti]|uniref:ESS family glutamate:Na+ symporter n=1 Tax=Caldalkalibacillus horti TaxID=77523 RepID=A0ABT9W4H7_9BACI|nr:sodium/glutamate symporter [Bacillus horti]MDQ0168143.1 ESS family glutamate:Na+ symporter [Bacillus horti]